MKLLITIILLVTLSHSYASAGKEGGGGGDIATSFVEYARYAVKAIKTEAKKKDGYFNIQHAEKIETAISQVEVFAVPPKAICTEEVGLDKKAFQLCHDAYYFQNRQQVHVNKDTWIDKQCLRKMALVLHEYGRAQGIEEATYEFSSQVFNSQAFKNWCSYLEGRERDRQLNKKNNQCNN